VDPTLHVLRLLIPAAGALLALPFGLRARTERTAIRAAYLFHGSGDPLATVSSDEAIPFEPTQLEPVLEALRDFVQAAEPKGHGFSQTSERFGEETLVAVRGRYVSACAVFRGNGETMLRRDLIRFVRGFEERNEASLETWEQAVRLADEASRELSKLVNGSTVPLTPEPHGGNSVRDPQATERRNVTGVAEKYLNVPPPQRRHTA
jgi:hypothetical protein